jgi:pantoate--beta-alanine ligase
MGFLHEGHLSLVAAARRENDSVIMTHYVNPLQFNEKSDLDRYPKNLDRDLALASSAGVDVVFAPAPDVMFGTEPATVVAVPALAEIMEGAHRPGHFEGVATVVAKLFGGLQPDRAYFGRKDAQQLAIVRRMAGDLSMPIEVIGCPIVREIDGLALSSRNVFLNGEDRRAGLALGRGLQVAADMAEGGETRAEHLERAALEAMNETGGVEPEYAQLASQDDVARLSVLDRPAFLAVAARVGTVRLIDNVHFDVGAGGVAADRGVRLEGPSALYEES